MSIPPNDYKTLLLSIMKAHGLEEGFIIDGNPYLYASKLGLSNTKIEMIGYSYIDPTTKKTKILLKENIIEREYN